jgi:hypothetical protein
MSDKTKLTGFVRRISMELGITEGPLQVQMCKKKSRRSFVVSIKKLADWRRMECGGFRSTREVENTSDRKMMTFLFLIHQETLFAITQNIVSLVSKLGILVRSKGLNHRQFKDLLRDMESEYGMFSTNRKFLGWSWLDA